jgi:hypothetical protein
MGAQILPTKPRSHGGEAVHMTAESLAARRDLDSFASIADLERSPFYRRMHYEQRHVGRGWTASISRGDMARAVV